MVTLTQEEKDFIDQLMEDYEKIEDDDEDEDEEE